MYRIVKGANVTGTGLRRRNGASESESIDSKIRSTPFTPQLYIINMALASVSTSSLIGVAMSCAGNVLISLALSVQIQCPGD
jgi:hypothetical protein